MPPLDIVLPIRVGRIEKSDAPVEEVREQAEVVAQLPGRTTDRVHQHRAVDALHDDLGTVGAHLFDVGHRISVFGDVAHGARLVRDRTAVSRFAQYEPGRELEDVTVASAGEQPAGFHVGHTMREVLLPQ